MNWTTIIYQIPREPQKHRMAVWRKLKSIAALNVMQSIWILPQSEDARAEFEELAAQIKSNGGDAFACTTVVDDEAQDRKLIEGFNREREVDYTEILDKCDDFGYEMERETKRENFTYAELEENEHELEKLRGWLEKTVKKDFFNCPLKAEVAVRLDQCQELLGKFADEVFVRNER